MLLELDAKGGFDNPLSWQDGDLARRTAQSAVGKDLLFSGEKFDKDLNNQQEFAVQQFIPLQGYGPLYLQTRGISVIDKSLSLKNNMPRSLLKKRPRYTIDTRLEKKIDEYYREVVRPRALLIESEEIALSQLKYSAGIAPQLMQPMMENKREDELFKMYQAQHHSLQLEYNQGASGIAPGLPAPKPPGPDDYAQMNKLPEQGDSNYYEYLRSRLGQSAPSLPGALPVNYKPMDWQGLQYMNAAGYGGYPPNDPGAGGVPILPAPAPLWQAAKNVQIPPKGKHNKHKKNILEYAADDEIDLDGGRPPGLGKEEWDNLKRKAFSLGLVAEKGIKKVKRAILDPLLMTLNSMKNYLAENKIALLAGAGAAGLAYAGYQGNLDPLLNLAGAGIGALGAIPGQIGGGLGGVVDGMASLAGNIGQKIGDAVQSMMPYNFSSGTEAVRTLLKGREEEVSRVFSSGNVDEAFKLMDQAGVSKKYQTQWMMEMMERRGVNNEAYGWQPDTGDMLQDVIRTAIPSVGEYLYGKDPTLAYKIMNKDGLKQYASSKIMHDLYETTSGKTAWGSWANQGGYEAALNANSDVSYIGGFKENMYGYLHPSNKRQAWKEDLKDGWLDDNVLEPVVWLGRNVVGVFTGATMAEKVKNIIGLGYNGITLMKRAFQTPFHMASSKNPVISAVGMAATVSMLGYLYKKSAHTMAYSMGTGFIGLARWAANQVGIGSPGAILQRLNAYEQFNKQKKSLANNITAYIRAVRDQRDLEDAGKFMSTGMISNGLKKIYNSIGDQIGFVSSRWTLEGMRALAEYRGKIKAKLAQIIGLEQAPVQWQGKHMDVLALLNMPGDPAAILRSLNASASPEVVQAYMTLARIKANPAAFFAELTPDGQQSGQQIADYIKEMDKLMEDKEDGDVMNDATAATLHQKMSQYSDRLKDKLNSSGILSVRGSDMSFDDAAFGSMTDIEEEEKEDQRKQQQQAMNIPQQKPVSLGNIANVAPKQENIIDLSSDEEVKVPQPQPGKISKQEITAFLQNQVSNIKGKPGFKHYLTKAVFGEFSSSNRAKVSAMYRGPEYKAAYNDGISRLAEGGFSDQELRQLVLQVLVAPSIIKVLDQQQKNTIVDYWGKLMKDLQNR